MTSLAHIAQRMFNVPVAIHPAKAEIIVAALSERLGIARIDRLVNSGDDGAQAGAFGVEGGNPRAGYDVAEGIAVIPVSGTLVHKLGSLRPYSGMTGYDGIRQNLLMAVADPDVKGILFDIDSPGGEVAGCFDLVDTIYKARGTKPIWAIVDEMSYSAGYAIASAAERVITPRTGEVPLFEYRDGGVAGDAVVADLVRSVGSVLARACRHTRGRSPHRPSAHRVSSRYTPHQKARPSEYACA